MNIPAPSQDELLRRIYSRLTSETGLNAPLDSSIVGAISRIVAAEMIPMWEQLSQIAADASPATASGTRLDDWGAMFGVIRKESKSASSLGGTPAVRITNNSGGPVSIPSGVRVFKSTDPRVAYFTVEGGVLAAGSSEDFHVTATNKGPVYNVGIGEIDSSDLTYDSISVRNILPITNGSNRESDGSYRDRVLQSMLRRYVLNESNTVALLRGVPGVRDVYMLPKFRGNGTFDAVLIPETDSQLNSIVSQCQALLNDNLPIGVDGLVRGPEYRALHLDIGLIFRPTATNRDAVRHSLRNQITAWVLNLPVENGSGNGTLYLGQIRGMALSVSTDVTGASLSASLDDVILASEGQIRLNPGERLVLRHLVVQ